MVTLKHKIKYQVRNIEQGDNSNCCYSTRRKEEEEKQDRIGYFR